MAEERGPAHRRSRTVTRTVGQTGEKLAADAADTARSRAGASGARTRCRGCPEPERRSCSLSGCRTQRFALTSLWSAWRIIRSTYLKHGLIEGAIIYDYFLPPIVRSWEALAEVVRIHRAAHGEGYWETLNCSIASRSALETSLPDLRRKATISEALRPLPRPKRDPGVGARSFGYEALDMVGVLPSRTRNTCTHG